MLCSTTLFSYLPSECYPYISFSIIFRPVLKVSLQIVMFLTLQSSPVFAVYFYFIFVSANSVLSMHFIFVYFISQFWWSPLYRHLFNSRKFSHCCVFRICVSYLPNVCYSCISFFVYLQFNSSIIISYQHLFNPSKILLSLLSITILYQYLPSVYFFLIFLRSVLILTSYQQVLAREKFSSPSCMLLSYLRIRQVCASPYYSLHIFQDTSKILSLWHLFFPLSKLRFQMTRYYDQLCIFGVYVLIFYSFLLSRSFLHHVYFLRSLTLSDIHFIISPGRIPLLAFANFPPLNNSPQGVSSHFLNTYLPSSIFLPTFHSLVFLLHFLFLLSPFFLSFIAPVRFVYLCSSWSISSRHSLCMYFLILFFII